MGQLRKSTKSEINSGDFPRNRASRYAQIPLHTHSAVITATSAKGRIWETAFILGERFFA